MREQELHSKSSGAGGEAGAAPHPGAVPVIPGRYRRAAARCGNWRD